jgi:hypothetical protein
MIMTPCKVDLVSAGNAPGGWPISEPSRLSRTLLEILGPEDAEMNHI